MSDIENNSKMMQRKFHKVFWDLLGSIQKSKDISQEKFYEKLQTLQLMIDQGVDINILDSSGSTYIKNAMSISLQDKYNILFSIEIIYFLIFQESFRPTIETVYFASIVCANTKILEDILKLCDDNLLRILKKKLTMRKKLREGSSRFWGFRFLEPKIIEVFQGFELI